MALQMVGLIRIADGRWIARKGIPQDVREDYARLYGLKREVQLKLPADTPRHEATVQGEYRSEQIMGLIFAIGFLLLPITASAVTCVIMWLLTLPFGYLLVPSGLNLHFLWFASLIVGLPASIVGTIICGPPVSRVGLTPWMVAFCAGVGAVLGSLFYLIVMGALGTIRMGNPPPTPDSKMVDWIMFATAALSGLISGGIFALLAGSTVTPKGVANPDLDI